MRWTLTLVIGLAGVSAAMAEQVETLFEQRFDGTPLPEGRWTLDAGAEAGADGLSTRSIADQGVTIGAHMAEGLPIPPASDGYFIRVEWSLVPVKIGGWGQDIRADGGPFVVEFTGTRPTLNAKVPARDTVTKGQEVRLSCDFGRNAVFSWTIDGKEQLDGPVPAWSGGSQVKLSLQEFKDTNSESRWLWVRISKVTPDDPLPLRLSEWDDLSGVRPDEPSPFLVGHASPMDKVFREAGDFGGRLTGPARVSAAGRERESFQLVVMPLAKAIKGTTVAVSDLLQADGRTRLTADHVTWHPVGYVQTKPSNSSIRRAGWWWPDVLMPAAPFDVAPGFAQPVWFTVDVPDGTPPGLYRGLIDIIARDSAPRTVGLELTVQPYSLPVRGKLRTAFCISAGLWEIWYQPDEVKRRLGMTDQTGHGPLYTSYECEDVLPQGKWREMYDFLLAHRISPTTIYSGMKNGRTRVLPGRDDMDYCYERGMNATCLANVDVLPADPAEADKRMAELEAWLGEWDAFIRERDWPDFTWYVHGFDESDMRPNHETDVDPSIRRIFGMIHEKYPSIKCESANPVSPAHEGLFDIITPLTAQWRPSDAERQAAGDELWAYVCCGPGKPYANLFIDFPGVDPRILGWQFHQHNLTGFLYYLMNLYEGQENWNMDGPKWPDRPWNPLSFGTNSDGILFYPGPDATPLASTRLENLRDGIEDYEALAVLGGLAERLRAAGGQDELVARCDEVLKVRPEVSKSWTEYTQEPERIIAARAEVDELIGAILALPGMATAE